MGGERLEKFLPWMLKKIPTARVDKLVPKLPFMIPDKPINMRGGPLIWRLHQGLQTRMRNAAKGVNELIRDERVEYTYFRAIEIRQYTERLIIEAMRNGDCHRPTMEMADFYLREKELIHKLFKVLVPRYLNYKTSFTAMHLVPINVKCVLEPDGGLRQNWQRAVLELKGNPFPPLVTPAFNSKHFLTNTLLDAAKQQYKRDKYFKRKREMADKANNEENAALNSSDQ